MLEQNFQSVYEKFKLQFFRRLFSQVREREGSLSAMEAFSVEVIHERDAPTIGQFADFLGISQSNATYKVNSLIRKGYIVKENSDTDRREYHLKLSDKFYCYNGLMQSYIDTVMARIQERFTAEELATFEHVLAVMSDELMPEGKSPPRMRYSHRPLAMPPLCKGRWQKYSIFDGGVADTGCDANLDVSIPQSALRLPAPFPQGSRGMRDGHTAHHRNCCALSKPSPPGEGFGRGSPGRAEAQRRSPVCVTSGTSSVFLYLRAKCGLMRKEKR